MNSAACCASANCRALSASRRSRARRSPSSPVSRINVKVSGTNPNSCCDIGKRRLFRFMGLSEITKRAETGMVRLANDDMVKHFDFQKLTGADEVAGHFDVSFGRG
jgi:hypothetical protein